MTKRAIVAVLLLAGPLLASPTFLTFPVYPTGEASHGVNTANVLECGRVVAEDAIVNATKIAVNIKLGFGAGAGVGVGIYPDDDALNALAAPAFGGSGVPPETAGIATATGLSPFTITRGQVYRVCFCATNNTGAYASPSWLSNGFGALQNAFVTSVGTAANTCTSAVPPIQTGALTPDSTRRPPILQVSVE